ncbi:UvrD-helicase domain-containing protein [Bifidobacterium amazonense]|uniref:DNA 3'-5' helicase n=1 Tax=Bifidobacterium amazonense TaxID=2809027 RepID=A0ABS9VT69_9BIFI|nr:ATP-dependent DNA helicase [Bifidobacterium amazonense]MCH9275292.1 UvrD-helicase domain-containing protein [Bifidobacterium amazonense]
MSETTFTDSPEQAEVISAPTDADVLVVAGAGSGKTYTMTRRIIGLIERGVRPERILGLTFTRKAASELLNRVSAAVAGTDADGRGAFLKPEVSTYDAFFQSIVCQYGLLVGFDQNTQPLSEAGAIQLASTVAGRHTDLLLADDWGSFNAVVGKMLDLSHAIGNAMIGGGTASVDEAIGRIRAWDAGFVRRLDEAIGNAPVPDEEPKPKAPRRAKKDTDAQYAAKRDDYRARLHELCVWRCAALRDTARRRDTLLTLVEEYEREKRRQNMAEFSDFTVAAYQLVSRFPSIGERYRRRYTHVLLDEYQDTSTTQAMLLAALFHAQDGGRSSVNAVGDPFQSIYAWRGASPGAFRMFQHDFAMGEAARPYPLSVTRRNSRIVLEAANNLTAPLRIPPRRAGSSLMREVDVAPLSAMDDAPAGTVGVLGLTTFGQEIDAVARFAKRAIARYGHDAGKPAPADGKPHVAVLFRAKTHMAEFAQGLERAGLTTLVVGYSALLERPDVRDLLALLHAAADHTDTNALMRLLATPRYGLEADDLAVLARLAERLDTQARYRSLVEAGLAEDGLDDGDDAFPTTDASVSARVAEAVRAYRDRVPHAVFLADLLGRGDLARLADGEPRLGERAKAAIVRAGTALRTVQAAANHPLTEVIETAVRALELDIDMIVAQAVAHPDRPVDPAAARTGVDAIVALVDTYTREIVEGGTPNLRGFMAWTDSLASIEEETAATPDTPADVVLMTIHQSKGLEWDAVAVAGMAAGTFPSVKGRLRITPDEDHAGGMDSGSWTPPEYRTTVATWLDDPAAVPVPVRVDAGILPRFPHDAEPGADPQDSLAMLDDVEVVDDEIYGDLRGKDIGDDMDAVDSDGWYLTQAEEYGRRLLADERRLAYVALTRARHDALLTYSRYPSADRDPRPTLERPGRRPNESKPSVFWTEVRDSLCHHADLTAVGEGKGSEPASAVAASSTPSLDDIGAERPDGFFVGEQAADYERAVVEEAWSAPLERRDDHASLPWPAELSDHVVERLVHAVEAHGGVLGAGEDGRADGGIPDRDSLAGRAAMLVADPDLMPQEFDDASQLDESVHERAMRVLGGGRQSVTALQARSGRLGASERRQTWRGIVRPIPRVASPLAETGTLFHAWAERFVNAWADEAADVVDAGPSDGSDDGPAFGTAPAPVTREAMIDDLAARERAIREREADGETVPAKERDLAVWQRRLVESRWAARRPAWAERQIVAAIPGIGDVIVNGKLDAVFRGGLAGETDGKRYTIVDWKTGRRPVKPGDVERRLVQLDWYRLLLSYIERISLESIDATLYYLREPDETRRELHARDKTEAQILAELRDAGVPEGSDDD